MNVSELHAKVTRLERELQTTRDLLAQATHDPEAVTAALKRTSAYAFSVTTMPLEDVVAVNPHLGGCAAKKQIPISSLNSDSKRHQDSFEP